MPLVAQPARTVQAAIARTYFMLDSTVRFREF
jgi:hypothetical protein